MEEDWEVSIIHKKKQKKQSFLSSTKQAHKSIKASP